MTSEAAAPLTELRRSDFDWPAGRSKGAPQLVLSAGGRRLDTQPTGIGDGPRLRQSARLPRRASVSARSPETPAWDETQVPESASRAHLRSARSGRLSSAYVGEVSSAGRANPAAMTDR